MGLELDMAIVLETIKVNFIISALQHCIALWTCLLQRPVGPLIGMFCQFVLMPLFSYLLGWLLLPTKYERLGLLMLGCSPGGANSNFWVETTNQSYHCIVTSIFRQWLQLI